MTYTGSFLTIKDVHNRKKLQTTIEQGLFQKPFITVKEEKRIESQKALNIFVPELYLIANDLASFSVFVV